MKKIKLLLVVSVCALLFSSCKSQKPGCLSVESAVEYVVESLKFSVLFQH